MDFNFFSWFYNSTAWLRQTSADDDNRTHPDAQVLKEVKQGLSDQHELSQGEWRIMLQSQRMIIII